MLLRLHVMFIRNVYTSEYVVILWTALNLLCFLCACLFLNSISESYRDEWICLNVGGERFVTTRSTLTKDSDSMLARMFASSGILHTLCWLLVLQFLSLLLVGICYSLCLPELVNT